MKNLLGIVIVRLLKYYLTNYGTTGNGLATKEIKPQFNLVKILVLA